MSEQMTDQQQAANFMAAASDLLAGRTGAHTELNNHVAVMFGPKANFPTLMHWGDWVRHGGRPIVQFSFEAEQPNIPLVALVDHRDGQSFIFENCLLWLRRDGGAVHIIPDSFKFGSYIVEADLKLKKLKRPPMPNFKAAKDGVVRAYNRLLEIRAKQIEDGFLAPLPRTLETRKAA